MARELLTRFLSSFLPGLTVLVVGSVMGWSAGAVGTAIIGAVALGLYITEPYRPPASTGS